LRKAVSVASQNVEDRTIEEVRAPGAPSIEKFATGGPWEDYLNYEFRSTNCGQGFRLTAETYHGAGGEWRAEDVGRLPAALSSP
jgi:hypothetical protein